MKKILLGTTILAGLVLASAAQAADMPQPVVKAPLRPVINDWTGFYIGIHGGYGWGHVNLDGTSLFDDPRPKGWVFGGQAGYLWQWGGMVGGLEIDYSAAGLKQIQTVLLQRDVEGSPGADPVTETLSSKIDALGSARARLGWLWTPNLLAYGTAGVGWAHSKMAASASGTGIIEVTSPTRGPLVTTGATVAAESSFGWVAGAGLEYQFNNNWRLRAEYLH